MNYKEKTKQAYNEYAENFDKLFEKIFEQYNLSKTIDKFLEELPGKRIIDLGSGPGTHAKYMKERGYDVTCVDISERMIDLCKEKGLKAEVMDMEELTLEENTFDGIWAAASFLHIERTKLPVIVKRLREILTEKGVIGIIVAEGTNEGIRKGFKRIKNVEIERYFVEYTEEELRKIFEGFEVTFVGRAEDLVDNNWLNMFFRKL